MFLILVYLTKLHKGDSTSPYHHKLCTTHQDLHTVLQAVRWIKTELFDIANFFLLNIYSAHSCTPPTPLLLPSAVVVVATLARRLNGSSEDSHCSCVHYRVSLPTKWPLCWAIEIGGFGRMCNLIAFLAIPSPR